MATGLPRDVLKWLLSLDLTYPVKNPKRDFSNGFTVAEIFARYYPQDVQMHSFDTGISMKNKLANWELLTKFFAKNGIPISNTLVNDLIHCKPEAGMQFIELVYPLLTNKKLEKSTPRAADGVGQPSFLRPTASKLIKESVSELEMQYKKDSPGYLAKTAEDIMAKQRLDSKVERADATSERLLSTTSLLGAARHATTDKVQRLSSQRPLNEPAAGEQQQQPAATQAQVEFKEIQIKAVDLDISRLRASSNSSQPANTNKVPLRV